MSNDSRYYIPKFVDEPARYIVFTLDELILLISILFLSFFVGHELIGLLLATAVVFMYQRAKRKESTAFVQKVLYRYLGFGPKNYIPVSKDSKFKG